MDAFKQNKLNVSTAAELAGLNEKYQNEACKLLLEVGQVTLNAAKLLKAQQEQERDIPGQMTIDQVLHPHKPEEINTPVPVDVQIDRFYESLRKNIETYVKKSDLNMTTYMLSALYGTVRVRNGQLNYQGSKEGILFNVGSDQEELMSWTDFSKKLIEKYGKKQKPVKMAAVDEPEELTIQEVKIEERIVGLNNTPDYSGNITEMAPAGSSETSIQPPLPVMKNNDQRKEWLRKYKEWGLWYTDEHIGARYYKYDFENGTRLIVEEYDPEPVRNSPWAPYEPHYMHLVGGPEPERNNGIPKWTYHSKYNKYPNSETELVEFLKGVQK